MRCLLAFVLLLLGLAAPVRAHDGLPLVITIQQKAEDRFLIRLTAPANIPEHVLPVLDLAPACQAAGALQRCPQGIGGAVIKLAYPGARPAVPTLARISWLSGETRSVLAEPGETRITLPTPESPAGVLRQYGELGVQHILEGMDHLLFLLCLLLIARTPRRILLTVTGFTLGHAVTITLVSLGLAGLPTPPVEATIALSIMFLAAELLRKTQDTLIWRHPVAVSSIFGVLHGFGFAAALRDIGLPQTEVPLALLAFNLGIEAGQLLFVLGCALLWRLLQLPVWSQRFGIRIAMAPTATAAAYVVGSVAAWWLVERTIG